MRLIKLFGSHHCGRYHAGRHHAGRHHAGRHHAGRHTAGRHTAKLVALCFAIILSTTQCNIYSFTGAALSPEVKTISISTFYNDASGGPPNMSQILTEKVKDYFQQNTNLTLVEENGDLQLEGSISRYDYTPVAPQASGNNQVADVAGLMRLTITVNASYVNTYSDEFDFNNRGFSFFSDFSAEKDPSSVEDQLVDEILDQIVFDIFTATVANW